MVMRVSGQCVRMRRGAAAQALVAARQDVALDQVNIGYNTLVAPRAGTIEYRIANIGEVLPAGGKIFTMLDKSDVYMDVYLSTADAGRTRIGADARNVLDAYPGHPIPAAVTFVAAQAQFTPKTVETKDERDSLMFRVRVQIHPARLQARTTPVKSGLPGVAGGAMKRFIAPPGDPGDGNRDTADDLAQDQPPDCLPR